jgi:Zn-dependent protease with chaperone function
MTISSIFHAWPGVFLAQSFLHSLVAALIVDTALIAWKIEEPSARQRFRLLVLVVPVLSLPLYQAIAPERGSALFRLDALFDLGRWLHLELWGGVPAGVLFLLFLLFTSAVFVLQELLPITRHALGAAGDTPEGSRPEAESRVTAALDSLPGAKPAVIILDDDECVMFSSTGKAPAVYLSGGLVEKLSFGELRATLAHEIGHIRRSRRPLLVLIFLLRMAMFFNPIILMEFRRVVQEEEKICDDLAVSLAGSRADLASALRKFYYTGGEEAAHPLQAAPGMRERLEEYSHSLLIESRITRLEEPPAALGGRPEVFVIVLATILLVNFYIV